MRLILKFLGIMSLISLPTMTIIDCTTNVPTPLKPIPPTYTVSIEKISKISLFYFNQIYTHEIKDFLMNK